MRKLIDDKAERISERVKRRETPTICDGLVIRYEFDVAWANKPEVNASRNGVSLSGAWPVMQRDSLDELVAVLQRAAADAARLRSERPW